MRASATTLTGPGCLTAICGWLLLGPTGAAGAIPASERAALVALYNSTNGPGWAYQDRWLGPPGTECTWAGVGCDYGQTHVAELLLDGNGLSGPLPPEIGDLAWLSNLYLDDNQLTSLPPQIGNLPSLVLLELQNNRLTSLPPQVGNLPNLRSLHVEGNDLAGLPPQIGDLPSLWGLYLDGNQLTALPAELGKLASLVHLDLGSNSLTALPPQIGDLGSLQFLSIGPNPLSALPPEIGGLASLTELVLYSGSLTALPPEIGRLGSLQVLRIFGEPLTTLPGEIGDLGSLSYLVVWHTPLATLPPEFTRLSRLRDLWLGDNALGGPFPAVICSLPSLVLLDLVDNELTGPIPPEIGNLVALKILWLDRNQLTGPLPAEIGNLASLERLTLAGNRVTGPLPAALFGLGRLGQLSLADNLLTGPIPPEIGALTNLWELDLSGNQFSGPIPKEIASLTVLDTLHLDRNALTGGIPPELGSLRSLEELDLSRNALDRAVPAEIRQLTQLYSLDLSENQLTGPIPSWIADLTELGRLDLSGNPLGGRIPPEVGAVRYRLLLANAQLSGPVPSTLSRWLETLVLSGNHLSGPIPAGLGTFQDLRELRLDGNQLRGPVPATFTQLTYLEAGGLDLRWNALHTTDPALRDFLDSKQIGGDWEGTQTVSPTGLAAGIATVDTVPLSWSPILYAGDTGGYRIWYGTRAGGPYNLGGMTADKTASASAVSGLSPGTTYYFTLDTVTEPHASNQNTVMSERSAEIPARTATGGLDWWTLSVTRYGRGAVASSPGGIACGGVCTAAYAPGAVVTLTAAPDPESTFLGWGGACAGTAPTCDLTMDAAQAVTATFSTPAQSYYTVTPCRVFDSRDAGLGGPVALAAGTDNTILVGGYCGVPPTAKAVSLNVTVVSPSQAGHLRLFASDAPRPGTSSVNYASGRTRANNAVASLGADGALIACVSQPSGTAHVVLDVNGYFQ